MNISLRKQQAFGDAKHIPQKEVTIKGCNIETFLKTLYELAAKQHGAELKSITITKEENRKTIS